MDYINIIELSSIDTIKNGTFYHKLPMANWDEKTYDLTKKEIQKISRKYNQISKDSILHTINKYIIEENKNLTISSVTEVLIVSFKHEGKMYALSQQNLGGVNTSWDVEIDDKRYSVISPELNKILSPFLARKMRAKKELTQFLSIKMLEEAFLLHEY